MSISKRVEVLDRMILEGKVLDALGEFFADDCRFIEMTDGSSRDSRQAQYDHLSGFFASLKSFDGATRHAHAEADDLSMSEWTFEMTGGDGTKMVWKEVLVRRWQDGRVVEERFYNATA